MAIATTETERDLYDTSGAATANPLSADELQKMHAYWRALNYLAVGQIYLLHNPLFKVPLERKHIKPRLLGHWRHLTRVEHAVRPLEPGHQTR